MAVTLLLVSLVLGFALARLDVLPQGWSRKVGLIGYLSLITLLFSLGLTLGSNPEITIVLPTLGLKALVLGLGAILGSVFLVWIATAARGSGK